MRKPALTLISLCIAAIQTAAAQPGSLDDPHVVTRATSEITIDGVVDESAWNDALTLELIYTYSALDVEGGQLFKAKVPEMKAVWQFNTRTFVRAIFQYTDIIRNPDLYDDEVDALSRDLFVHLLFSYKVNPRIVFFLGYSDSGHETQDFGLTTTDRTLFLKLGYYWIW